MLNNVLHVLIGAALVAIGVLAAALADRIRGIKAGWRTGDSRLTRETPAQRETSAPRERTVRATNAADTIFVPDGPLRVIEPAELLRAKPASRTRMPRSESKVQASAEGAEDVIAALRHAGYAMSIATEATWACSAAERATIEDWTRAALRRCARGGMS